MLKTNSIILKRCIIEAFFSLSKNLLPAINDNGNVMKVETAEGGYIRELRLKLTSIAHPSQNTRYLTGDSRGPNEIDSLTRV